MTFQFPRFRRRTQVSVDGSLEIRRRIVQFVAEKTLKFWAERIWGNSSANSAVPSTNVDFPSTNIGVPSTKKSLDGRQRVFHIFRRRIDEFRRRKFKRKDLCDEPSTNHAFTVSGSSKPMNRPRILFLPSTNSLKKTLFTNFSFKNLFKNFLDKCAFNHRSIYVIHTCKINLITSNFHNLNHQSNNQFNFNLKHTYLFHAELC